MYWIMRLFTASIAVLEVSSLCTGTHAAFRRVYEEPIVQSRQPTATLEEREIGEMRANEVCTYISFSNLLFNQLTKTSSGVCVLLRN